MRKTPRYKVLFELAVKQMTNEQIKNMFDLLLLKSISLTDVQPRDDDYLEKQSTLAELEVVRKIMNERKEEYED